MKTKNLFLILSILTALMCVPTLFAEETDENIWSEEDRPFSKGISEERIEQVIDNIAQDEPDLADHLRDLRRNDPGRFEDEFRDIMRERIRRHRRSNGDMHGNYKRGTGGGGKRGSLGHSRLDRKLREFVEWLEQTYPDAARDLADIRNNSPQQYKRHVGLLIKKYGKIMHAEKEFPELASVLKEDILFKDQRDDLLKQIKIAEGEEKQELIEELEEVVNERFDLIVIRKQLQYEQLREKLEQLEKEVEHRENEVAKLRKEKDTAVQNRVEELIGETEKINWD